MAIGVMPEPIEYESRQSRQQLPHSRLRYVFGVFAGWTAVVVGFGFVALGVIYLAGPGAGGMPCLGVGGILGPFFIYLGWLNLRKRSRR